MTVRTERQRRVRRIRFNVVLYLAALAAGIVAWLGLTTAGVAVPDLDRNAVIYVAVWTLVEAYLIGTDVARLRRSEPSETKIQREMQHLT